MHPDRAFRFDNDAAMFAFAGERGFAHIFASERRFRAMLGAIVGVELAVEAMRGTGKLSQNKPAAAIAGVLAGLDRTGDVALAAAMRR